MELKLKSYEDWFYSIKIKKKKYIFCNCSVYLKYTSITLNINRKSVSHLFSSFYSDNKRFYNKFFWIILRIHKLLLGLYSFCFKNWDGSYQSLLGNKQKKTWVIQQTLFDSRIITFELYQSKVQKRFFISDFSVHFESVFVNQDLLERKGCITFFYKYHSILFVIINFKEQLFSF